MVRNDSIGEHDSMKRWTNEDLFLGAVLLFITLWFMSHTAIIASTWVSQETKEPPLPSQIILQSPDGNRRLTLKASNDVVGIWTENKDSRKAISIYENDDHIVIGVHPDDRKMDTNCLTIDKDGNGKLLLWKDGRVRE